MTSQAKAFQWSVGIPGMVLLIVVLLQSLAVSQARVVVIDFTLSGNAAPATAEQPAPPQAPSVHQAPKLAKAMPPKEVLKKESAKEVAAGQPPRQSESEKSPSPSEVSSTPEEVPPSPPRGVDGPGGSSAEEKGNSVPSPLGGDGGGEPSANASSRDVAKTKSSRPVATERSGRASAGPSPEASRAAYLKEHFTYIRDRITGSIAYPHTARKMGWCGQVKIAFVVCEDGGVNEVRVIESSGFSLLDRNVVDTVKHVAPFPNPPVRAEIRMAISYRLH